VPLASKPKDITAGLEAEFTLDEIPGSDGVKRFKTITKLPPVFQIYLQRQDFDHARQDAVVNKHHIQLEDVIYLDRFANPDLHGVREKSWELDAKIKELQAEKASLEATSIDATAPDLLEATWQFVSTVGEDINADAALVDSVRSRAEALRADVRRVESAVDAHEQQRRSLFEGHRQYAYKLAAVFMHRGQGGVSGGHYWVHIRDFNAGVWRRYEDRDVRTVTDLEEIYGRRDPETEGAPYYVAYVREDQAAEVFDAVCRVKPADHEDTVMGGTEEGEVAEQEPKDDIAELFEPEEEQGYVPMIS
jgi:ubiquitin carboxyl-terminal hydrolase 25/28